MNPSLVMFVFKFYCFWALEARPHPLASVPVAFHEALQLHGAPRTILLATVHHSELWSSLMQAIGKNEPPFNFQTFITCDHMVHFGISRWPRATQGMSRKHLKNESMRHSSSHSSSSMVGCTSVRLDCFASFPDPPVQHCGGQPVHSQENDNTTYT